MSGTEDDWKADVKQPYHNVQSLEKMEEKVKPWLV